MARPRNDAPRPDTQLIALRVDRALLVLVDEHARRRELSRSAAVRDLVVRGLRTTGRGHGISAETAGLPCPWCRTAPGARHQADCPRHPDSPLHSR